MKATFLFVLFLMSLLFVKHLKADSTIIVNELLPDAVGTDSGKEYVELYNNSSQDINIKDWYFINTSQTGSSKKIILPDSIIKSKSYFVIAEDLITLGIQNGTSIGSGKLALYNDFGKLQLFNSSAVQISEVNYGDSKEGISWDLDGPICNQLYYSTVNTVGLQNSSYRSECFNTAQPVSFPPVLEIITVEKVEVSLDGSIWTDTISTYTGTQIYFRYKLNKEITPNSVVFKDIDGNVLTNPYTFSTDYKNIVKVEVNYNNQVISGTSINLDIHNNISNKVLISEAYPSPESPDKEWIEIYNNDSLDINLSNYYIEEKTSSGVSNTRKKLKDQVIHSFEYYVIYEDEFNASLNNSGDTIYLIDLYGNTVNQLIYSEANKSSSVGRKLDNNIFSTEVFSTLTPTPLQENKFGVETVEAAQLATFSLEDLPNLKSGTEFTLNTKVINFIDKYIFINDGTTKLKAKLTKKIEEDIANTNVKLKAKVTTTNGVKNLIINPDDIEVLEYINSEYNDFDIKNISNTNIGDQYRLEGNIKEVYSNRIKIDISGELISVYTNNTFNASEVVKNKNITVFGTLDFYRNAYRLIEIDHSFPEVESANTVRVSEPVSFVQVPKNALIPQNFNEDYSKVYLVTFGYVTLGVILLFELIRSRNNIIKFIKRSTINPFKVFGKPVIKY